MTGPPRGSLAAMEPHRLVARGALLVLGAVPLAITAGVLHSTEAHWVLLAVSVLAAVLLAATAGAALAPAACPGVARTQLASTAALVALGSAAGLVLTGAFAAGTLCAPQTVAVFPWSALWIGLGAYAVSGGVALSLPRWTPIAWPAALLVGSAAGWLALASVAAPACFGGD
jgi:hypothetical protein